MSYAKRLEVVESKRSTFETKSNNKPTCPYCDGKEANKRKMEKNPTTFMTSQYLFLAPRYCLPLFTHLHLFAIITKNWQKLTLAFSELGLSVAFFFRVHL